MDRFGKVFPFRAGVVEFFDTVGSAYRDFSKEHTGKFLELNPGLEVSVPPFFDEDVLAELEESISDAAVAKYTTDLESMEACDIPSVTDGPMFINLTEVNDIVETIGSMYLKKEGDEWPKLDTDTAKRLCDEVVALLVIKILDRIYKELMEVLEEFDVDIFSDSSGKEQAIVESAEQALHLVQQAFPEVLLMATPIASEILGGIISAPKLFMACMSMEMDDDEWHDEEDDSE